MVDYGIARSTMVNNQLRTFDVSDRAVLAAMGSVPREAFVPAARRPIAYLDSNMEVSEAAADNPARYLLAPSTIGRLLQAAEIQSSDIALVVGCTTGYVAAIMAKMADSVVALECDAGLAEQATEILLELSVDNAAVVTGDLEKGWPEEGPYDVVVVAGAVDTIPDALLEQVRDNGRLAVVEGHGGAGQALIYTRTSDVVSPRFIFNASAPILPGFERQAAFEF